MEDRADEVVGLIQGTADRDARAQRTRWRRQVAMLLALGLVVAAAGCLSDEQRAEAEEIALGDPRFTSLLASHPYEVVEVREPQAARAQLADAVVEIEFDAGFPDELYPADVCSIGGHDGLVTGVRWLVDLDDDSVVAVTPVWGDVSCGDGW